MRAADTCQGLEGTLVSINKLQMVYTAWEEQCRKDSSAEEYGRALGCHRTENLTVQRNDDRIKGQLGAWGGQ